MFVQLIAALIASSATQPVPYEQVAGPAAEMRTYQGSSAISAEDMALFREGLAAARAQDVVRAQDAAARIGDPVARRLVEWALIDTAGDQLSYATLAAANVSMADWPRYESRRAHAEIALERAAMPADVVLSFFGQTRPATAQGALALAGALEQTGRAEEARTLIRT
ncbi:MAG: lytic transglycosylase domain-containing protein, partial [Brevundimonas sp.]